MMAMMDVVSYLPKVGPVPEVCGLGPRGRRPSGALLHSSHEPGVRRPCNDFMDMLRHLINCCIIIIIIN